MDIDHIPHAPRVRTKFQIQEFWPENRVLKIAFIHPNMALWYVTNVTLSEPHLYTDYKEHPFPLIHCIIDFSCSSDCLHGFSDVLLDFFVIVSVFSLQFFSRNYSVRLHPFHSMSFLDSLYAGAWEPFFNSGSRSKITCTTWARYQFFDPNLKFLGPIDPWPGLPAPLFVCFQETFKNAFVSPVILFIIFAV